MIDFQKEYGISPAVGVLLLLGITAGISAVAGIVLLDTGNSLTESVNAGVEVQETPGEVSVSWNQPGNAEEISVRVNGTEVTRFKDVNDSIKLGVSEDSTVTAVGISDSGAEEVVKQNNTDSDTRDGSTGDTYTVKENNVKSQKVTGTIRLNPKISGAKVETVKNGSILDSTETDSNGKYELVGEPGASVNVEVEGDVVYNSRSVYATGSKQVGEDMKANIDFDETRLVNIGTDKSVVATEEIRTVKELQAIKHDLDGNYELVKDIDATETQNWNSGNGFEPIGEFTGSLDGNNHTISNLTIDRTSTAKTGMFSRINGGSVSNLTVDSAQVFGSSSVGIIAGEVVNSSSFANLSVTGTVDVTDGSQNIGGMFGSVEGMITNVQNSATVLASNADRNIGGIAGYSSSTTYDIVSNTGSIVGNVNTGGISGDVDSTSTINSASNSGDVTGRYHIGGIVGEASSLIKDSSNTGKVTVKIAQNQSGSLSGGGGIAGVIEYGNSSIENSYNTGTIDGTTAVEIGGVVGKSTSGTVDVSYNEGSVNGDEVGGVVGALNSSTVTNSYNTGVLSTSGVGRDSSLGGVVEYSSQSTISNVYNTGDLTASGQLGGVLAFSDSSSTLDNAYNTGILTGDADSDGPVGGVVGMAEGTYTIDEVYNTGSISVTDGYEVGGVSGILKSGTISNAYSTGSVTGRDIVGGFVGEARTGATIENSFSTGVVSLSSSRSEVGGFSGISESGATYTEAYWDTENSGQTSSPGSASGLTTSEMQGENASTTMSGFDYNSIWKTTNGYPDLQ